MNIINEKIQKYYWFNDLFEEPLNNKIEGILRLILRFKITQILGTQIDRNITLNMQNELYEQIKDENNK